MTTLREKYDLTGNFFYDAVILLEEYHRQRQAKKDARRKKECKNKRRKYD